MFFKVEFCVASHVAIMFTFNCPLFSGICFGPYVKNLHPDYGMYLIALEPKQAEFKMLGSYVRVFTVLLQLQLHND